MNCPSCHGTIDVSGVFPGAEIACPSCGTKARVGGAAPKAAPKDVDAAPALQASTCPTCSAELELRHHEAHVASVCPDGHGVFVTRATLSDIGKVAMPSIIAAALDEASSVSAEEEPATTRNCPRCREPMTRRAAKQNIGVVVDVCAEHGTWFDAGELREVLGARARPVDEKQAKATLDVALALETAREKDTMRRGVEVAEDILDVLFGSPYRRRRGLF